ncbi:MAG TPA: hypothetical protein ENI51_07860 [Candidatus Atribacteria bacterium]|nr:hypothetical protein [Candidatus Atribacteria bacterium]
MKYEIYDIWVNKKDYDELLNCFNAIKEIEITDENEISYRISIMTKSIDDIKIDENIDFQINNVWC